MLQGSNYIIPPPPQKKYPCPLLHWSNMKIDCCNYTTYFHILNCNGLLIIDYSISFTLQTFPKPWTVTAFVTMLLRLIKIADYGTKTPILHAIMLLHCQDPLNNVRVVVDIIMSVLTKSNPPTCQEEDQKVCDELGNQLPIKRLQTSKCFWLQALCDLVTLFPVFLSLAFVLCDPTGASEVDVVMPFLVKVNF